MVALECDSSVFGLSGLHNLHGGETGVYRRRGGAAARSRSTEQETAEDGKEGRPKSLIPIIGADVLGIESDLPDAGILARTGCARRMLHIQIQVLHILQ